MTLTTKKECSNTSFPTSFLSGRHISSSQILNSVSQSSRCLAQASASYCVTVDAMMLQQQRIARSPTTTSDSIYGCWFANVLSWMHAWSSATTRLEGASWLAPCGPGEMGGGEPDEAFQSMSPQINSQFSIINHNSCSSTRPDVQCSTTKSKHLCS